MWTHHIMSYIPEPPPGTSIRAWRQAILWFGVGDLLTSIVGVASGLARESTPYIAALVLDVGVAGLVIAKTAGFVVGYLGWRLTPKPFDIGIPIGLAAIGLFLTIWNVYVLAIALRLF